MDSKLILEQLKENDKDVTWHSTIFGSVFFYASILYTFDLAMKKGLEEKSPVAYIGMWQLIQQMNVNFLKNTKKLSKETQEICFDIIDEMFQILEYEGSYSTKAIREEYAKKEWPDEVEEN